MSLLPDYFLILSPKHFKPLSLQQSLNRLCFSREEVASLRDKIRADHERALQEAKEKLRKSREELQAEIQTEKTKVMEDLKKKDPGPKPLPPVPMPKVVGVSDGEPPEPDAKEKRDKIREVRKTTPLLC